MTILTGEDALDEVSVCQALGYVILKPVGLENVVVFTDALPVLAEGLAEGLKIEMQPATASAVTKINTIVAATFLVICLASFDSWKKPNT